MNRITPREISQRLAQQAERFCQWLLPNGRLVSGEWYVGSPAGEAGNSCKVRVCGERAGVWADFAGNDKGDLLDLIRVNRSTSIGEAIRVAKDWLGIRDPESVIPRKHYAPCKPKGVSKLGAGTVLDYLTAERKLAQETLTIFKIAQAGGEMAFPSYNPGGDLLNVKYIGISRDTRGKKQVRQESGCAPGLFGWQAIRNDAREVVITEGQIDAMTWHQLGFPALSVPDGVASDAWIDFDWSNLERFDSIYLSFDNDPPGQTAVNKVAKRLGLHRCFNVTLPEKDANDTLRAGGLKDTFDKAIRESKPFTPEAIKAPIEFLDAVLERFDSKARESVGFRPRIFGGSMVFLPGETTLWTGTSGHGKSLVLSQMVLAAVVGGQRAALASLEMSGAQSLHRLICQTEGFRDVPPQRVRQVLEWLSGRLWIFDLLGNLNPNKLFDLMEYSTARHGVHHIVVDSLMKIDLDSGDYEAQRKFMDRLCTFGRDSGAHIHIVAHARKGQSEAEAPGKLDVKGSSDLINQVDNVLSIWRNKAKEQRHRANPMPAAEYQQTPDGIAYCSKQRESGIEFEAPLFFTPKSFTFTGMTLGARGESVPLRDELLIPLTELPHSYPSPNTPL